MRPYVVARYPRGETKHAYVEKGPASISSLSCTGAHIVSGTETSCVLLYERTSVDINLEETSPAP